MRTFLQLSAEEEDEAKARETGRASPCPQEGCAETTRDGLELQL